MLSPMEALLITSFITAMAVCYAISFLENFVSNTRFRGPLALVLAIGGNYLFGLRAIELGMISLASAFISLTTIFLLDRPRVVPGRRL